MASIISVDTLQDSAGSNEITTANVKTAFDDRVKASINFNGTGTVAIRYSLNVASIVDNTTGDYTTNLTNDMSDADYTVTTGTGGDTNADNVRTPKNSGSLAAGSFSCNTVITGTSINDAKYVYQTVHGDLA